MTSDINKTRQVGRAKRIGAAVSVTTALSIAAPALGQIDEIVVKARKRDESIQTVPIAVTAFDAETISGSLESNISDFSKFVPNVQLADNQFAGGALNMSIRGIQFSDLEKSFEPSVGVSIDGVFLASSTGANIDVFDLEQIEILRGPQGTLYGRNTIGGSINVRHTKPTGEFGIKARGRYGSFDRKEGSVILNLPKIADQLSTKFNFFIKNEDLFTDNVDSLEDIDEDRGQDIIDFGGAVLWEPTATFNALVNWNVYNDDSFFNPAVNLSILDNPRTPAPFDGELVCPITFAIGGQGCSSASFDLVQASGFENTFGAIGFRNFIDGVNISAELNAEVGNLTLTSVTGYRESDEQLLEGNLGAPAVDLNAVLPIFVTAPPIPPAFLPPPGTLAPIFVAKRNQTFNQFSQELRLTSDFDGPFNFVGGLYYLSSNYTIDNGGPGDSGVPFPTFGATGGAQAFLFGLPINAFAAEQDLEAYAVFGEGTYDVTDKLRFTGGFRFTYERKDFMSDFAASPVTNALGAGPEDINTGTSWTSPTGRASFDYSFNDDALVYVSWSRGFRSGGFNGRATAISNAGPYDPEIVNSYEIGARTDWLDGRLRVNPTLFLAKYKDKQEEVIEPNPVGLGTLTFVRNAASVTIKGVELEVQAVPMENMFLRASAGYLDAEYDEYLIGGVDVSSTAILRQAPKWTVAVGGDYTWYFNDAGLTFSTTYNWSDDIVTTPVTTFLDTRGLIEGGGALDLSLTLDSTAGDKNDYGWSISAFGKDVLQEDNQLGAGVQAGIFFFGVLAPKRRWGIESTFRY